MFSDISSDITWLQNFFINVLKVGPIPKHLAVIMDGNRRYAKKNFVDGRYGHVKGFEKLTETLQWCLKLGISQMTVYAFSTENMKRSPAEVEALMQLAKDKFQALIDERDKLMAEGIHICIFGNLSLLPPDIRQLIAEVMLITKGNNKVFFNIAVAYTAREEIVHAVSEVANGVNSGFLKHDHIDKLLLSKCLYMNKINEPDLLIRTSGETRFSDFMLWQINYSPVHFTKVLWPEFCIWHLFASIFTYQQNVNYKHDSTTSKSLNFLQQKFLEQVDNLQWMLLEEYAAV